MSWYVNSVNMSCVTACIIFSLWHCQYLCAYQSLPDCFETKQTLFAKHVCSQQFSKLFSLCASPMPGKRVYLHVKTICVPYLHQSILLNLWSTPWVMSKDGDDAFTAVFPLLLTDSNSHDGNNKKPHDYLTHALAANSPWNFQLLPCCARLSVHLANPPAQAFLQEKKYCLVQAGQQQGRKTKLCLKPPFQIRGGDCNKCQEIPSPLFQPQGKSYFCSDLSSSLRPIDCSIQLIFTSFVALWFARDPRAQNNFHFNHFLAVDIKDMGGLK